jgi:hypothetical protein
MSPRIERIVIWLILLTVPVQGAAAATAALRGPAHYHAPAQAAQNESMTHDHAFASSQHVRHTHEQVRRHYHLPGDDAVVAVVRDAPRDDVDAAAERSSRVELVSAAFVAVLAEALPFHALDTVTRVHPWQVRKLLSHIPSRIERPPAILPG